MDYGQEYQLLKSNTNCWNCGGKGHKASDCLSRKAGGNRTSNQVNRPKSGLPLEMKYLLAKKLMEPFKYNPTS